MKDTVWKSVFAEEFESYLRLRASQGHVNRKDRTVMKTLEECFLRINLSEKAISSETAEIWFHSIQEEMSVNTRIVYLSHYRQFARYLNTLGYPAFVPEPPIPEKTYIPYIFSEEEMCRLIHAADLRIGTVRKSDYTPAVQFSVILRMLWGCGLRLNEVLLLKAGATDAENGLLLVRNAKGNKDRLVPMHSSLTTILVEYMRTYGISPEMYLFPGREGIPHHQGWARTHFCKCLEASGIVKPKVSPHARNICLHCIRHSFAAASFRQLQQSGHDLYDEVPILSTYLGHENIHGTERYLHMTEMNGTDILCCMESWNDDIFPEEQTIFMKQLAEYFETFLPEVRHCSPNTISAYADSFVILFRFFEDFMGKAHYLVRYRDLTPQMFDEYVLWMRNELHYSPASQKQRISAVTAFLKYASRREVSAIAALNAAASSQTPKVPEVLFPYFSAEEMKILLHLPAGIGKYGLRDQALLCVLYDSAARAQEMCNLCVGDFLTGSPARLRLHGKGSKVREVPISKNTEQILKHYLSEQEPEFRQNCETPLFFSQRSERMTTACVRNLVQKYVEQGRTAHPELFSQDKYSPHSFRHSKAIHMLDAGVPLIYIRNFLGHESVSTTERYARVSQSAVNRVLEKHSNSVAFPEKTESGRCSDRAEKLPPFLTARRR